MFGSEKKQKIIGTLVPVFALKSLKQHIADYGTFETGISFLDWLKKTDQSAWQLLPLNETQLETGSRTKHVPSPYKGYGIGLSPKYLASSFVERKPSSQEKKTFIALHNGWIHDYALFCALRDHYGTDDWRRWDSSLKQRQKSVLAQWNEKLTKEVDFYITQQWQLHTSYALLHSKAKKLAISLIGDLPYYLSIKSPLVWAHQDVFQLEEGNMEGVSGIPNARGAHFGRQIWGHPLYNWKQQEKVIAFWKMRLRYQSLLFDMIRFDHAKAFFEYGVIDLDEEENDRYERGPGAEVFKEVVEFGREQGMVIFAEDSGDRAGELRACLEDLNMGGIKIYRFAMRIDGTVNERYSHISDYPENCVAYTTTHDTETLLGHLQALTPEQKQKLAYASKIPYDSDDKKFTQNIRNAIINSPARTVVIAIQDWLLTTERINIPGTEKEINDPNWHYQLQTPVEKLPTRI